jgi:hypothetical protein
MAKFLETLRVTLIPSHRPTHDPIASAAAMLPGSLPGPAGGAGWLWGIPARSSPGSSFPLRTRKNSPDTLFVLVCVAISFENAAQSEEKQH